MINQITIITHSHTHTQHNTTQYILTHTHTHLQCMLHFLCLSHLPPVATSSSSVVLRVLLEVLACRQFVCVLGRTHDDLGVCVLGRQSCVCVRECVHVCMCSDRDKRWIGCTGSNITQTHTHTLAHPYAHTHTHPDASSSPFCHFSAAWLASLWPPARVWRPAWRAWPACWAQRSSFGSAPWRQFVCVCECAVTIAPAIKRLLHSAILTGMTQLLHKSTVRCECTCKSSPIVR
jgi:hypothetical protein